MNARSPIYIVVTLIMLMLVPTASAQEFPEMQTIKERSAKRAFGMSLLFPGWGHYYAQNGSWRGRATLHAGAEVGLWISLISAEWRKNHFIQSYQTLAATRGNANIKGKDRTFYLNLATYQSSDEYLAFQLRNRFWDRIDYVDDPAFHWQWDSSDDFQEFRDLREDAESLRRRRSIFIALMVANRLLAGLNAIQAANNTNATLQLSLGQPLPGEQVPVLNASITF